MSEDLSRQAKRALRSADILGVLNGYLADAPGDEREVLLHAMIRRAADEIAVLREIVQKQAVAEVR